MFKTIALPPSKFKYRLMHYSHTKLTSILFIVFINIGFSQNIRSWPEIEPYHTGYLKVLEILKRYYEFSDNPEGKAGFVLYKAPVGGCTPNMPQFFNPDKFHIILNDQRGGGKSIPFAVLKENSTLHLIENIETLRKHLSLDKAIIFGRSRGSALGLAFAGKYPKNVDAIIWKGIFLASLNEINQFYYGGNSLHFPEGYQRFKNELFKFDNNNNIPDYLLNKLTSPDSLSTAAYAWVKYETKISKLLMSIEAINK